MLRYVSVDPEGLEFFSFVNGPFDEISNAFFSRRGGVSQGHYRSLNLSVSVGDSQENVAENRLRCFKACNRSVEGLFDVWQVHGTEIVCANSPRNLDDEHKKADGILTDNPGITLLMRFADCVPIVLYDWKRKVIGIVHAGWQGTVNNIAGIAVQKMVASYGSKAHEIVAGIGPSIGPDDYKIGPDVYNIARDKFGDNSGEIFSMQKGSIHFNLWKANELLLKSSGIKTVIQSELCTGCDTETWYSHRVENGKTGRFAALIGLKDW